MLKKSFFQYFVVVMSGLLFLGFPVFAETHDEAQSWDVEHEIPHITHIGRVTPEEQRWAVEMRQALIENMTYWRAHGLPNPPDLQGIYHFSDYEGEKVIRIVEILNPGIPDVRQHVLAQYEHLKKSELAFALRQLSSPKKGSPLTKLLASVFKDQDPLEMFFDYYARIRYGFSVYGFLNAIQGDLAVSQVIKKHKKAFVPERDNAFFGRFPRIDLIDALPLAQNFENEDREINWDKILNNDVLKKTIENPSFSSRRIVFLARSTEQEGDTQISTLRDHSVGTHELGHHMVHTLAEELRPVHRMVDEVMADYLAAAPTDNPLIGEFFARASGIIADRIEKQNYITKEDRELAKHFADIGARGFLRDFSKDSQITSLQRFFIIPNDYDGGHPLRTFLWKMRSQLSDTMEFDTLLLKTVAEFSQLPKVIAPRAAAVIQIREIVQMIYRKLRRKMLMDKARPAGLSKEFDEIIEERFGTQVNDQLKAELKTKEQEKADKEMAKSQRLRRRPPIPSDYVIPEFLRTLYRVAARSNPDLVKLIRIKAEIAMDSGSLVFGTSSGDQELVFVRRPLSKMNPAMRLKAFFAIRRLDKLRKEYQELLAEKNSKDEKAQEKRMSQIKAQYGSTLDAVHQFERTGSTFRFYFPHPILAPTLSFLSCAGSGVKWLGKCIPAKKKKSQESCQDSLKKGDEAA